jgi:phosphinothricin acetyltransferase
VTAEVTYVPFGEEHLDAALAIYNHYIATSTATFHIVPRTRETFRREVFFDDPRYGTTAILEAATGALVGYCLLKPLGEREAYRPSAEVSIYLHPDWTRRGIGRHAMTLLEEKARAAGFHALVAAICGENDVSIRLMESLGYVQVGRLREVGRKHGRWLDVVDCEKLLD